MAYFENNAVGQADHSFFPLTTVDEVDTMLLMAPDERCRTIRVAAAMNDVLCTIGERYKKYMKLGNSVASKNIMG
jgi:hypothetical protein